MKASKDLGKNTIMLATGTFMTKGLSFIMIPFFSRWLSTEDYGTFDLLCTYVTVLIPLIGLSSNEAVFRLSVEKEDSEKSKYISSGLAIFSINYIIVLVIGMVLFFYFKWNLALCFCLLLGGELYNIYLRGFLRAIKHLDVYSFVSAVTTCFIAVFVTLFIKGLGFGLSGIIIGYALGYIVGDIIVLFWTKYWKYFSIKKTRAGTIKEMVKYSYALIPNSIAWWIINVSDRTIINIFLGASFNGIFAIAHKIPNLCSSVFQVFSVSWQQTATEVLNKENRNSYYNSIYNKMLIILISICCGILSLNSCFFNFIFDNRYYDAHLYIPILVCAVMLMSISQFYGSLQISFCQPKENGYTTVLGAVINLVVHLCLIKIIGLYAAAISTFVSQFVVCVVRLIRLRKNVVLQIEDRTKLLFLIFLVFVGASYYITNMLFNIVVIIASFVMFVVCNYNIFLKLLKSIKLKKGK